MKLQKQKSDYKRGYSKYVIVIPEEIVKEAGLKEGDELEGIVDHNKIIIKKV